MNITEQGVIDKIKKLLAIANDSAASDNEVSNAMKLVNNLLLKHNLQLGQLDLSDKAKIAEYINRSQFVVFGEIVEEGTWEQLLINVLCEFNLCEEILHTTKRIRGGKFIVVGSQLNVECVLYMFETCRRLYRSLSKARYNQRRSTVLEEYKRLGKTEKDALKSKDLPYRMPWIRSYLKGCVEGLKIKLDEQRRSYDAGTLQMIAYNHEALEIYIENQLNGDNNMSTKTVKGDAADDSARILGLNDALTNDLTQGITGQHDPTKHINQTLKLNESNDHQVAQATVDAV